MSTREDEGVRRRNYMYARHGKIMSPLTPGRGLEQGAPEAVTTLGALREQVKGRSRVPDLAGAGVGGGLGALYGATAPKGRRGKVGLIGGALGTLVGGTGGYMYGKEKAVRKAMRPVEHASPFVKGHVGGRLRKEAASKIERFGKYVMDNPKKSMAAMAVGSAAGTHIGINYLAPGAKNRRKLMAKERRDPRLYANLRGMATGISREDRIAAHKRLGKGDGSILGAMKEGWGVHSKEKKGSASDTLSIMERACEDELQKIGGVALGVAGVVSGRRRLKKIKEHNEGVKDALRRGYPAGWVSLGMRPERGR